MTIRVGSDAHPFSLYKELACHDAEFFETAFNSSFREANEQEISLPDDDVQIFKIYQTWLNKGELRYNFDDEEWWLRLAKLWIFADKIRSIRLKNKTIDAFFDIINDNEEITFADTKTVHFVYENTAWDSPLRRIFVRFYLHLTPLEEPPSLYPQEFLAAVVSKVLHYESVWRPTRMGQDLRILGRRSEAFHEDCAEDCCKSKPIQN